MVSQVSFDREGHLNMENSGNRNGETSLPSYETDQSASKVPVKKQTRQWAAWTHQEEESFFSALRQVGKNFEKITNRVQSKNKDQVRHYYYRLVRRMNKLLGPEHFLDAKNSKDTNSAMLRWWSLLEKHSCKASKLHLKPRRFKIFIETLENQLIKDRKRSIRKRNSNGESISPMSHIPASSQVKLSVSDSRPIKLALVDSHNIQKGGTGKSSLLKRHVNLEMNRANYKVDQISIKVAKHRRKTAAYKRWETAAIAGVTLVADAAEQLERVNFNKNIDIDLEIPGHNVSQQIVEMVDPLPVTSQNPSIENHIQNSAKLKLQLFPIDEWTQKKLEVDHHNPHLELTLSTRKKISSVVEHLNKKWRNSSIMSEELMLFPYWAQRGKLAGYQKWTKDCPLCAADIYHLIGSPPVFRLRYGWFSEVEIDTEMAHISCANEKNSNINIARKGNFETESPRVIFDDQLVSTRHVTTGNASSICAPVKSFDQFDYSKAVNTSRYDDDAAASLPGGDAGFSEDTRASENKKNAASSAGEWADSLTNISIGDLLSESENIMGTNYVFPVPLNSDCQLQGPFSCDSFDVAIAAHIFKHRSKVSLQQELPPHAPSIWDDDETRDAFVFQKNAAFQNDSPEACEPTPYYKEELPKVDALASTAPVCGDLLDNDRKSSFTSGFATNNMCGVTDIYWPDSLGPLDLDIPQCRYNDNLILSDSLSGLNRLIANSLDAFQSLSFLRPPDKEEPESTSSNCQTVSISNSKICGELKNVS